MFILFICSSTDFSHFAFKNVAPSTFTHIRDDQHLTTTSFPDAFALHSGVQDCVHDVGKFSINRDWIYIER